MDNQSKRYLRAAAVRKRYGNISDMTLWRWLNTPQSEFPQPRYFGRRRFWEEAELDAYDRQCAARCAGGVAGREVQP
jgi:predicted DNA-binding transcriptional regulator AlpA